MVNSETTSGPGRPKSEQKRAAILEAAGRCFLDRGPGDTSMDAVARAAGVSKQTVYSHFGSKEDLFQAVIENKCRDYSVDWRSLPPDPEAGLLAFARAYLALMLDPDVVAMVRQVICQSRIHPEIVEIYCRAGPDPTRAHLADYLADCHRRGALTVTDPATVAADFLHETGARFRMTRLMGCDEPVSEAERDAHARRRVAEFLVTHRPGG